MIEVDKFVRSDGYTIKGTNLLHREDGPAVIHTSGAIAYYINNKLHREDGPAVIHEALEYKAWYYNNKFIQCSSQEEFEKLVKLKVFW